MLPENNVVSEDASNYGVEIQKKHTGDITSTHIESGKQTVTNASLHDSMIVDEMGTGVFRFPTEFALKTAIFTTLPLLRTV